MALIVLPMEYAFVAEAALVVGMPMTAMQHIEAAIRAPGLCGGPDRPTLQLQPIATAAARAHEEACKRGHEAAAQGHSSSGCDASAAASAAAEGGGGGGSGWGQQGS